MARRAVLLFLAACHSAPSGGAGPASSGEAVMLPAPVQPGTIADKSPPNPGGEVVVCFQQTRGTDARGTDCRVSITASPLTAAHLHRAARVYLGGSDYLALYHQPGNGRGPRVDDDATEVSSHVVRNDEGRHFLFLELSRK